MRLQFGERPEFLLLFRSEAYRLPALLTRESMHHKHLPLPHERDRRNPVRYRRRERL